MTDKPLSVREARAAPTLEWIIDAQEELMDAILYLERLKVDFD